MFNKLLVIRFETKTLIIKAIFCSSFSSKIFLSRNLQKFSINFFHLNFPHRERKIILKTRNPSPFSFKHIWIKHLKLTLLFRSLLPSWNCVTIRASKRIPSFFIFFFHHKMHEENFILISPTSDEQTNEHKVEIKNSRYCVKIREW